MKLFHKKKAETDERRKQKFSMCQKIGIVGFVVATALAATILPRDNDAFAVSASIYKTATSNINMHMKNAGQWYKNYKFNITRLGGPSGVPLYCVEPLAQMQPNTGLMSPVYDQQPFNTSSNIGEDKKPMLQALSYFGYGYGGRTDERWYCATQEAVYDYVAPETSLDWGPIGANSGQYNADIDQKKAQIVQDANNFLAQQNKTPEWQITDASGSIVAGPGKNVSFDHALIGETYTITDTKGAMASGVKLVENPFGSRLRKVGDNSYQVTIDESDIAVNRRVRVQKEGNSNLSDRGSGVILAAGNFQNLYYGGTPGGGSGSSNSETSFSVKGFGLPVEFVKKSEGGQALAGAKMSLYRNKPEGKILVEEFETTTEPKVFGLVPGEYEMVENEAPRGYYKSRPVTFTVRQTTETQHFEMTDKPMKYKVQKVDGTNGSPLTGVHLQMGSDIDVYDSWVTDGSPHVLDMSRVKAGDRCKISETETAEGYYLLSGPVYFNVPEYAPEAGTEGLDSDGYILINVKNATLDYAVDKLDAETGGRLAGATLQILDDHDKVVDEWVTDGQKAHKVPHTSLQVGRMYRIHEVSAPKGYHKLGEDVPLSINQDHMIDGLYTINVRNMPIRGGIMKTDMKGAPVVGAVLGLYDESGHQIHQWVSENGSTKLTEMEEGKQYYVQELQAPKGYLKTDEKIPVSFNGGSSAAQEETQIIRIKNPQINYGVDKIDAATKERLAGVEFEIKDDTGTVVATVTSRSDGPSPIPFDVLEAGRTYTIHEARPLDGYGLPASDQTFTVPSSAEESQEMDDSDFTFTFEDQPFRYSVVKVDKETGAYVPGAHLSLYGDQNGNDLIYSWVSTEEPEMISDHVALEPGKTYYVRETREPDGFFLNESPVAFTVNASPSNNKTVKIEFENQPISWRIRKEAEDGSLLTTNNGTSFILDVYDTNETKDNPDDDTLIASLDTSDKKYKADGYFDMAEYIKAGQVVGGHTYRIHERQAADGYDVAADVFQTINMAYGTDTTVSVMTDPALKARIRKVDENGQTLTTYDQPDGSKAGFTIGVYDEDKLNQGIPEEDAIVASIDTSDPEYIKNGYKDIGNVLSKSKTYVAKETTWPKGFYKAKDVHFTIDSLGDDYTVQLVDPHIKAQFRKEDEVGNVIQEVNGEGFEFTIFDTNGTDQNTSDDISVGVINTKDGIGKPGGWVDIGQWLQDGHTYRIHETYAPAGFDYADKDAFIYMPGYYEEKPGHVINVIVQQ